jgi:hypothetical protein
VTSCSTQHGILNSCTVLCTSTVLAGDLAFNIALGATLVALPLSIGAAARSAFVKYKFTDKRVSVKTDAPWESECLCVGDGMGSRATLDCTVAQLVRLTQAGATSMHVNMPAYSMYVPAGLASFLTGCFPAECFVVCSLQRSRLTVHTRR